MCRSWLTCYLVAHGMMYHIRTFKLYILIGCIGFLMYACMCAGTHMLMSDSMQDVYDGIAYWRNVGYTIKCTWRIATLLRGSLALCLLVLRRFHCGLQIYVRFRRQLIFASQTYHGAWDRVDVWNSANAPFQNWSLPLWNLLTQSSYSLHWRTMGRSKFLEPSAERRVIAYYA